MLAMHVGVMHGRAGGKDFTVQLAPTTTTPPARASFQSAIVSCHVLQVHRTAPQYTVPRHTVL
jgi:hypothetical protein